MDWTKSSRVPFNEWTMTYESDHPVLVRGLAQKSGDPLFKGQPTPIKKVVPCNRVWETWQRWGGMGRKILTIEHLN